MRDLIDDLAREATSAARALGHALDADKRIESIHAVLGAAGMGVPSILADAHARWAFEIAIINGAVVRAATEVGVPVRRNEAMVARIERLERGWQQGDG